MGGNFAIVSPITTPVANIGDEWLTLMTSGAH